MNAITATELMAMKFGKPNFVVEGVLSEGLTILGGSKGQGKSFMALDIAVAVAEASMLWNAFQATQGTVLFLAFEDTMPRIQRRLAMRGDKIPEYIEFCTTEHNFKRLDAGGLEALADWIARTPTAKAVVLDTLGRVAPISGNYDSTTNTYSSLSKFAHDHHIAILACHHFVKKGSKDPFLNFLGSTGLGGAADTLLALKRQRFNTDATLSITGKDVEETELAMRFDGHRGTWAVVGAASDVCASTERQVLRDIIADHGQPMTLEDIEQALEKKAIVKEPGTTRVLLTRMVAAGEVSREGRGRYVAEREKLHLLPLLPSSEGPETISNNSNNGNEVVTPKGGGEHPEVPVPPQTVPGTPSVSPTPSSIAETITYPAIAKEPAKDAVAESAEATAEEQGNTPEAKAALEAKEKAGTTVTKPAKTPTETLAVASQPYEGMKYFARLNNGDEMGFHTVAGARGWAETFKDKASDCLIFTMNGKRVGHHKRHDPYPIHPNMPGWWTVKRNHGEEYQLPPDETFAKPTDEAPSEQAEANEAPTEGAK